MLPELNGNPIEFTKNNSDALKNLSVNGNINLNTNTKINTEIIEAIAVVFRLIFL